MASKALSSIESQIEMWSGIRPPNERAREMAAGLESVLKGFEALRGQVVFEDEPSSFEAALQACKEREAGLAVPTTTAPRRSQPSSPLDMSLVEAADAVARGETTSLALTKAAIEAFGQRASRSIR